MRYLTSVNLTQTGRGEDRHDRLHDTDGSWVGTSGASAYQCCPADPGWEERIKPTRHRKPVRWQVGVPRGPEWDATPVPAAAARGNLLQDPKTSSQGVQQHLSVQNTA